MQRLRNGMLFAIGIMILAGCSTGEKGVITEEGKAKGKGASSEDTLVIARLSDAESLDHHFMATINAASVTHGNIYEGLVGRDKGAELQPLLADSWEQIDDTTWEFKLRQDVKFHDGTDFTAEAVKATFDRLLDPAVGSPKAGVFSMVEEVKVIDAHTVQFLLSKPYSPLLSILASHESGIINPKAIEKFGGDDIQEPSGTGPFKFESWTPGQKIVLNRNEDYWGTPAKVSRVEFKVVPEESTRTSMVELGEAHIAEPLSISQLDAVNNSKNSEVYQSEGFGTEYITFNVEKKPFDDVRVRKAVSHAIEMDAIRKGVYNNVGGEANSLLGTKVFGYHDGLEIHEYNLSEAKRLLAEAGYSDGLEIKLTTMDNKERIGLAEVVQSQLKGIGIKVNIEVLEYGTFVETTHSGNTEMIITSWRNVTGDADYNQYNLMHSSSKGASGNTSFYGNSEVDELIEDARKESDSEKRLEMYAKAQEIQMEDAVYIPVRIIENVAVISKDVSGFAISPSGYLEINNVSIK
ncbi:glutathione ABC transporter substrate-binding protein [Sporosarcina sp. A2]|uniref:glutathione ABC transporter substrate-binding protein n=1 Tax=Sporosarcina sp. A2 TaxID=3393449 RepID=UPI003D7A7F95